MGKGKRARDRLLPNAYASNKLQPRPSVEGRGAVNGTAATRAELSLSTYLQRVVIRAIRVNADHSTEKPHHGNPSKDPRQIDSSFTGSRHWVFESFLSCFLRQAKPQGQCSTTVLRGRLIMVLERLRTTRRHRAVTFNQKVCSRAMGEQCSARFLLSTTGAISSAQYGGNASALKRPGSALGTQVRPGIRIIGHDKL